MTLHTFTLSILAHIATEHRYNGLLDRIESIYLPFGYSDSEIADIAETVLVEPIKNTLF